MAGPLHMGSPRVASPRCGPSHKVACRCTDGGINRRQGTQLINWIVQETINVGTETVAALKAQTEQMSPVVNELDSIHFSIKKASQLVKEIGTQVATDRCIMAMLFLIFGDVIAIIIVKIYSLTLVLESFIILKKNPKYHEE